MADLFGSLGLAAQNAASPDMDAMKQVISAIVNSGKSAVPPWLAQMVAGGGQPAAPMEPRSRRGIDPATAESTDNAAIYNDTSSAAQPPTGSVAQMRQAYLTQMPDFSAQDAKWNAADILRQPLDPSIATTLTAPELQYDNSPTGQAMAAVYKSRQGMAGDNRSRFQSARDSQGSNFNQASDPSMGDAATRARMAGPQMDIPSMSAADLASSQAHAAAQQLQAQTYGPAHILPGTVGPGGNSPDEMSMNPQQYAAAVKQLGGAQAPTYKGVLPTPDQRNPNMFDGSGRYTGINTEKFADYQGRLADAKKQEQFRQSLIPYRKEGHSLEDAIALAPSMGGSPSGDGGATDDYRQFLMEAGRYGRPMAIANQQARLAAKLKVQEQAPALASNEKVATIGGDATVAGAGIHAKGAADVATIAGDTAKAVEDTRGQVEMAVAKTNNAAADSRLDKTLSSEDRKLSAQVRETATRYLVENSRFDRDARERFVEKNQATIAKLTDTFLGDNKKPTPDQLSGAIENATQSLAKGANVDLSPQPKVDPLQLLQPNYQFVPSTPEQPTPIAGPGELTKASQGGATVPPPPAPNPPQAGKLEDILGYTRDVAKGEGSDPIGGSWNFMARQPEDRLPGIARSVASAIAAHGGKPGDAGKDIAPILREQLGPNFKDYIKSIGEQGDTMQGSMIGGGAIGAMGGYQAVGGTIANLAKAGLGTGVKGALKGAGMGALRGAAIGAGSGLALEGLKRLLDAGGNPDQANLLHDLLFSDLSAWTPGRINQVANSRIPYTQSDRAPVKYQDRQPGHSVYYRPEWE